MAIKTDEDIKKALNNDKIIAYYLKDSKYPNLFKEAIFGFVRSVRLQDKREYFKK